MSWECSGHNRPWVLTNLDELADDEDPFGEGLGWRTFGTNLKEVTHKRNMDPRNLSPILKRTPYDIE
eukprot:1084388-Prorocentrum_lima.AAC.1